MGALVARGQITIVDLHDGVSYTLNINGGVRGIAYAADGSNPDPTTNTATDYTVEVLKNGVKIEPYSYSWTTGGCLSGGSSKATFRPIINTSYISGNTFVTVKIKETRTSDEMSYTIPVVCTKHADGLDWIGDWNGTVTDIKGNRVVTPKLFAGKNTGTSVNPNLTGVAVGLNVLDGNDKTTGIVGYKNNDPRFKLDTEGNFFVGSGWGAIESGSGGGLKYDAEKKQLNISGNVKMTTGSTIGNKSAEELLQDVAGKASIHDMNTRFELTDGKISAGVNESKAYADTKDGVIKEEVRVLGADLSIAKNQISLKVEQADIDKTVSNVVIGGRNLILNSKDSITAGYKGYYLMSDIKTHIKGKQITVACDFDIVNAIATNATGGKRAGVELNVSYVDGTSSKYIGYWVALSSSPVIKKGRFSATGLVGDKDMESVGLGMYIQGNISGGTIKLSNPKVELGTKPTDWTPAPEDTDKAIADTVTLTEEKIKTAKAEIKIETDRINLEVGKTNSVVTSHTTSIGQVDGKINTAKGQAVTEAVGLKDRRSNNDNPQYYFTTYPRRTVEEFKFATVIGIPNAIASKYGVCTTIVPWSESSGGYPTQTFRSDITPTFERKATSTTAWGSWVQIEDVTGSQNKATQALNTSKTYTETKVSEAQASIKLTTDSIKQSVSSVDTKVNTVTVTANNKEDKNYRVIYARGTGADFDGNRILTVGNTSIYNDRGRGLRVTVFNPVTLVKGFDHRYDTYGADITAFVNKINEFNNGTDIIVITSCDSASLARGDISEVLSKIGGIAPSNGGNSYREAYALIGRAKLGKGNGIEMYIPKTATDKRFAEVSVKVSENGAFMGVNSNNIGETVGGHTTSITNTNTKVATIETNLSSITQRVSSTENTTKTINDKVVSVDNRLRTAENKITDSAIVNTVKASQSNGKNTFAQTSTVEQLVNQVKFDFSSSGGYNLLKNGKFELDLSYWLDNGGSRFYRESYEMGSACASAFPGGITYNDWVQLKPNTDYVYQCLLFVNTSMSGQPNTPLHWWARRNISDSNNSSANIQVVSTNQNKTINSGWNELYVHFRTTGTTASYFRPFIYSQSTVPTMSVTQIMLSEATVMTKFTPHPNEIYSGNTIIDASGVTINNGALRVKNNAGQEVISADSAGNLWIKNNMTVGGNTHGSVDVKNSSGVTIFTASQNGTFVKDGVMKITNGNVSNNGINYPSGSEYETTLRGYGSDIQETSYAGSQIYKAKASYHGSGVLLTNDNSGNSQQTVINTHLRYNGLSFGADTNDQANGSPWYGIGRMNIDIGGGGSAIQLAGYWGLRLRSSSSGIDLYSYRPPKMWTPHGYLFLGPQNDSHCHYETDRDNHWFNKRIIVNGNIELYGSSNLFIAKNNYGYTCADNGGTARYAIYIDASNELKIGYNGERYINSYGHFMPAVDNSYYLGAVSPNRRWKQLCAVAGSINGSDSSFKQNIRPILKNQKEVKKVLRSRTNPFESKSFHVEMPKEDNATGNDFYNFMKDTFTPYAYDYKMDEPVLDRGIKEFSTGKIAKTNPIDDAKQMRAIGFVADEYDIANDKVAKEFIFRSTDGKLNYNTANYTTVVAIALKEAIDEIEELKVKNDNLQIELKAIKKHLGIA